MESDVWFEWVHGNYPADGYFLHARDSPLPDHAREGHQGHNSHEEDALRQRCCCPKRSGLYQKCSEAGETYKLLHALFNGGQHEEQTTGGTGSRHWTTMFRYELKDLVINSLPPMIGQPNVMTYAGDIAAAVGFCGDTLSNLATILLGFVKVLATLLSLLLVDKVILGQL